MKKLAVLGHPISHTLSPVMHTASIRALGLENEYEYGSLDVPPDQLMPRLALFPAQHYAGVNLTVPLKETAYRNLDHLSGTARLLGAVNTVEFTPEGPVGHNTDGFGFLQALHEAFGKRVKDDRLFILGCGGAGRAVALTAAMNGARSLTLADIDEKRVRRLVKEIHEIAPGMEVFQALGRDDQIARCRQSDLVVQASPVGMKKTDPSLLPAEAFNEKQRVFDLIYMYPETAVLQTAAGVGARTANGLSMLLHQGAQSFRIWTGLEPDLAAMRTALEKAVYS